MTFKEWFEKTGPGFGYMWKLTWTKLSKRVALLTTQILNYTCTLPTWQDKNQ